MLSNLGSSCTGQSRSAEGNKQGLTANMTIQICWPRVFRSNSLPSILKKIEVCAPIEFMGFRENGDPACTGHSSRRSVQTGCLTVIAPDGRQRHFGQAIPLRRLNFQTPDASRHSSQPRNEPRQNLRLRDAGGLQHSPISILCFTF